MKLRRRLTGAVCAAALAVSAFGGNVPVSAAQKIVIMPNDESPFGEFQGWGTSLCWWANRVGYSEKMTKQAADLFFSEDGLGLNIARYNLGGGDDPEHNHITRSDSKVPGVWKTFELSEDGKDVNITEYDLSKDQNQLNIAKAALEANPDLYFEGFSNSAPYFMTNSGCTGGGDPASSDNLKSDMYDDFGKFIAEATKLFKEEGIEFKSYSPMNEPDTNYWGVNSVKQEGCHFDPGASQSKAIVETRKALDAAGLTDVIVAGMDETDIDKSVSNLDKLTDEAKEALGRIDTHTYGGSKRVQLKEKAKAMEKVLWMSEVDKGGDGFTLADMIITDMNGMQPAAWVMWDIVDKHKDSTFVDPSGKKSEANTSSSYTESLWGVGMANHDTEELIMTQKYYAFGQFTRYIKPGMTIVASSAKSLAAYDKKTGEIVIVVTNSGNSDEKCTIDMSAFEHTGRYANVIRTSGSNEKWAELVSIPVENRKFDTELKARSITTFVVNNELRKLPAVTGIGEVNISAEGISYKYDIADDLKGYDSYFAVYDKDGALCAVTQNQSEGTIEGDFTDCTFKLMVWDGVTPKTEYISKVKEPPEPTPTPEAIPLPMNYAIITGGGSELSIGVPVQLSVETNMEGEIVWSVDDEEVAEITQDGVVTAKSYGNVTVTAKIDDFAAQRSFEVLMYTVSGTASWGNDSTAPSDNSDYLKAVDGDLDTFFDGVQNGYVLLDYGSPYKPSEILLAARAGEGMPERTVGGRVQGSNDGIGWTDLYIIESAVPAGEYTTVDAADLLSDKAYRYFRYTNPANMTNIAEFKIRGELSDDVAEGEPIVKDIAAFTDNFEGAVNIFEAETGDLSTDGNKVFVSGLGRFGNVFAPVNDTATAETETIELTEKDKFRLTFDMFAGWESSGKENDFSIKDENGDEIIGFTISGGGYNLNRMRIGGTDLLASVSNKPVSQSRSNPGTNNKAGANGWNASGQPYRNTVGYNKYVEIVIDGTGTVSANLKGGMEELSYKSVVETPITIKSMELTGSYNVSRERVVSYDNFNADVITYDEELAKPTPTPEPTPTPIPTEPPVMPESGELINLDFDNGDLSSSSAYGRAAGTPKFVTEDERKCIQFDGTASTVVKLTDANGNGLLAGQDEITISFDIKPTSTDTSWWFFGAPNDTAQAYQNEVYLGAMTKGSALTVERYKNSGSRLPATEGTFKVNEWNEVMIAVGKDLTELYVNGVKTEEGSPVKLSDIFGASSVAYIGRANWGSGEYAKGYMDNFVITKGVKGAPEITVGDLSAVTEDLDLPSSADDGSPVVWTSSNTDVITNDGKVTRPEGSSVDVILTAKITKDGKTYIRSFTATVVGKTDVLNTFVAYFEDGSIFFTSEYDPRLTPYNMEVSLKDSDGNDVGEKSVNKASGSFDDIEYGIYTVECVLTDENGKQAGEKIERKIKASEEIEKSAYLFVHFVNTEGDANCEQIYFSVSENGTDWTTLNNKKPVLTSNVGERGVRDPYILRGEDGKFFIIATDLSIYNRGLTQGSDKWGKSQTEGSKSIVVWESENLVDWSEASLVKVSVDNAGCTWAPETVYDPEKDMYMVFWASKVSDDKYSKQRVYRSYTKDFKEFTAPEIYIEDDVSNIDTTITDYKGVYYRFTKNETKSSVIMEKSTSLSGVWKAVAGYTLADMTGYEGPAIYKLNGENKWCLLLDFYSQSKGYKPFVTDDLSEGNFTGAGDFKFDGTYRHGTVLPITAEEYEALTEKY